MAITPTQEALYDENGTAIQAYAYILKPDIIYQATVTSYITREGAYIGLVVDSETVGALADIENEQTIYLSINGGLRNGGSQRVRSIDAPNNTIYIGRAAAGTAEGQISGVVGATVIAYDEYRPHVKAPYIVAGETPVQYKDETLYPGHNAAQPPVASFGADRLVISYNSSESVELSSSSFAVRQGATIATLLWDTKDGTITDGTTSSQNITVSFPRGKRWVSLTATDSNGIAHKTHRLIVVARPEDCMPVRISSMVHSPYGNSLTMSLRSNLLDSDLPSRAKVLVAETENYHGTLVGYDERFSGWLQSENSSIENARRQIFTTEVEVEDTATFLQRNNLFPQSLNAIDSEEVGGWFQMRNANIDRMMHYILHWHTNILSCAGFSWSGLGATYPFPALTTSGGTFWQNIERLARAFGHELVVNYAGALDIAPDPHVLPTASQATEYSLPTQRPTGTFMTFTRSRYQGYSLPAEITPESYWLQAMGIVATNDLENVTVVGCVAPSNAPGFGTGAASRTDFLCTSQDELNIWAANQFASKDGTTLGNMALEAVNPAVIIDPSLREFVEVELPTYLSDRHDLLGRWTVEQVEYSYSGYTKTAVYTLKKEIVAQQPARTLPQLVDETLDQSWSGFDTSIVPTTGEIIQGFTNMALTQEELEQTLSKTRLKVYLSQFETDDDGNTADGGTGGDPTVPDDPTDPESVYLANSYRNGGYFNASKQLDEFLEDFAAFYTAVSGEINVKTLIIQYVEGYLLSVPTGAASAWADYIVDTPDATLPSLTDTTRLDLTEYMYCLDSVIAGLSQYIIKEISSSFWDRWNTMAACISQAQADKWYSDGVDIPFNDFPAYFCYTYPPQTLDINTVEIHAQDYAKSNSPMTWSPISTGTDRRIVSISASGKYEDADYIKDSLYVYDKTTEIATLNELDIGAQYDSEANVALVGYVDTAPPYNPDGVYIFAGLISKPSGPSSTNVLYVLRDTRSPAGTGSGLFTVTFTDLGRYNY